MPGIRRFAVAGYLVALVLVLFPFVDVSVATWPPRISEAAWRFGAAGLLSRVLITPMLGLLLASLLALLLEQRRTLRVFSVLSGVAALVLTGLVVLFVLDVLEMRTQVRPEAKAGFDAASLAALAKYGLSTLIALAFMVGGWRASRDRGRVRPDRPARAAAPLIAPRAATPSTSALGAPAHLTAGSPRTESPDPAAASRTPEAVRS